MDSSSSPSTSSVSTPRLVIEKCVICTRPAHGNHFGVECCRACAAFFRRVYVSHKQQFKCFVGDNNCEPDIYGRWQCKRCRTEKCLTLGMKPDNIQRDRDRFICSEQYHKRHGKNKRISKSGGQLTVERPIAMEKIKTHLWRDGLRNEYITYFDVTSLISDAEYILKKVPVMNDASRTLNSLEKLAVGLQEVRKSQIWEDLPTLNSIGKLETWNHWVKEIRRSTMWIMYFDKFRDLEHDDKMTIMKCMWLLFTRLERIAMTAEMRKRKLCDEQEYIYSYDLRIHYDKMRIDKDWFSDATEDEVRVIIGPLSNWFCEVLITSFMEFQPTDVELSFMLCNLCFHIAGKHYGGKIQETTDRLQDVLANDLHEYYLNKEKNPRYSYRLAKMLGMNRLFQTLMTERKKKIFLADTMNVFRVKMSHPEMFQFSC